MLQETLLTGLRKRMVPEVAILDMRPGQEAAFEAAFREDSPLIAGVPGCVSHELQHYLEPREPLIKS